MDLAHLKKPPNVAEIDKRFTLVLTTVITLIGEPDMDGVVFVVVFYIR